MLNRRMNMFMLPDWRKSKYAPMPDVDYKMMSTFWDDFTIADCFGEKAVKDTFRRAYREWKTWPEYLTELVMTLNWKMWQRHDLGDPEGVEMYRVMFEKAHKYALKNLKGEDLQKFFEVTD